MAVAIQRTLFPSRVVTPTCRAAICEDHHEGHPRVAGLKGTDLIVVLCSAGHVYDSIKRSDWVGSPLESMSGNPDWTVVCHGALTEV